LLREARNGRSSSRVVDAFSAWHCLTSDPDRTIRGGTVPGMDGSSWKPAVLEVQAALSRRVGVVVEVVRRCYGWRLLDARCCSVVKYSFVGRLPDRVRTLRVSRERLDSGRSMSSLPRIHCCVLGVSVADRNRSRVPGDGFRSTFLFVLRIGGRVCGMWLRTMSAFGTRVRDAGGATDFVRVDLATVGWSGRSG